MTVIVALDPKEMYWCEKCSLFVAVVTINGDEDKGKMHRADKCPKCQGKLVKKGK